MVSQVPPKKVEMQKTNWRGDMGGIAAERKDSVREVIELRLDGLDFDLIVDKVPGNVCHASLQIPGATA